MLCFGALESFRAAVVNYSFGVILGFVKRLHCDQRKVLAIVVPLVLGLNTVNHLQWSIVGSIIYSKWLCRVQV